MAAPITLRVRNKIIKLHGEGVSRNGIAKAVKVSSSTVTRVIRDAGLSFDRAAPKAATEARILDARARRVELQNDYLAEASKLLAEIRKPHLYFDWGGKDHDYDEREQPEPTAVDKLKLVQASGIAIDRAVKLAQLDVDTEATAAVDQWIEAMTKAADE